MDYFVALLSAIIAIVGGTRTFVVAHSRCILDSPLQIRSITYMVIYRAMALVSYIRKSARVYICLRQKQTIDLTETILNKQSRRITLQF